MFVNGYPYTDFHEMNLDWIIEEFKNVHQELVDAKLYVDNGKLYIDGKLADATYQVSLAEIAKTAAQSAQALAENARDSAANSATAAAGSATAAAGSATQAAQTVANTLSQVSLLQSRVDNIIPSGTQTEGNTELIDIRVGANGVTYSSAGDAVRVQVSDLNSDLDYVSTELGYAVYPVEAEEYNQNHYVNYKGELVEQRDFSMFGLVELYAGMTIKVTAKGYSQNVSVIATTDENAQSFAPVVVSTDDAVKEYTYTAQGHTYVVLSSNKSKKPTYRIEQLSINNRLEDLENGARYPSYAVVSGKYINYLGEEISFSTFAHSNPIQVTKGEIIDLYARGDTDRVAMIATCTQSGTDITPQVIAPDAVARNYNYTVENDGYIIISYDARVPRSLAIYKADSMAAIIERIEALEEDEPSQNNQVNLLSAFDNLTCIGDSLTWSQVFTGASKSRQAYVPYPKALSRKTGADYQILARAGATAYDAWNEFKNQIIARDNDLTIIYLGTNIGLTDTVDTDCVGDDYESYANTHTGRYGSIIQKSLSLGNRVVLVKVHSTSGNLQTTNTTIEHLATRFNVPVIDNTYLSGTKYHSYPDGTGTNGTHYNDFGYSAFADQVINRISSLSDEDLVKIIPN